MNEFRDRRALVVPETRDPAAATQKLQYTGIGQPMVPNWDSEQAIQLAYYANVFVFACVRLYANTLMSLPFRVGADPEKPQDFDRNAGMAKFLGPPPGTPNPEVTARRLWAWTVAMYIVTGRYAWEFEPDDRGFVAGIWPLQPQQLKAIPSEGGREYFSGFKYGQPGKEVNLPKQLVHYVWRPSLTDYRQPESWLQAARLDISVAVMQDRYDYAFLKNDARPASVVVHEAFEDLDERDAWRGKFLSDHQGVQNAGKPIFVEFEGEGGATGAIDIKQLGLSQRDAQFIQRYKEKIGAICVGLGVPLSKLDASGRTFDNAKAEDKTFWESSMLPLLTDLADETNRGVAPLFDGGSKVGWFDISNVEVLKPDSKFTSIGPDAAYRAGLINKDEGREALGEEPTEGGGEFFTEPEPPAPVIAVPDPNNALPPVPDDAPDEEAARTAELNESRIAVEAEVRRNRVWLKADAQIRGLEKMWHRQIRSMFRAQKSSTLSRLTGKRGRQAFESRATADPSAIFDKSFWKASTEDIASGLYDAVFAVGGARVSEAFGVSFDLDAPFVQDYIAKRSKQLAGQVTDTTYDSIKGTLAEGVANGESIEKLSARVGSVFDDASEVRSEMIARTEVISAYNGSAVEVATNLDGITAEKEWIATRDGRVRESHADADGQVVAIDQQFDVGGASLEYPGDPYGDAAETVNCRCTLSFSGSDESFSYSSNKIEKREAKRILERVAANGQA